MSPLTLTILGSSPAAPNPGGACSGYLLREGETAVLVDCGAGTAGRIPAYVPANRLAAVAISHLHPDHTNGIRAADNSMAFPNAEIMVPAKDWEFWMSEDNRAKAQSNQMMKDYFANVQKIYAGIEDKVTKSPKPRVCFGRVSRPPGASKLRHEGDDVTDVGLGHRRLHRFHDRFIARTEQAAHVALVHQLEINVQGKFW